MNISLPPAMKKWVDQQVKARGFGTSSEFVRHVLRAQWEAEQRGSLEAELLRGLDSGPALPLSDKDWEAMRREGKARIAARSGTPRRRRRSA